MYKLKAWWYIFKKSLTDPRYYKEILEVPFSFSLKYFYFLIFLVILIKSLQIALVMAAVYPSLPQIIQKTKITIVNAYPAELKVTIQNGELSTNVHEPYIVPIPQSLQDNKPVDMNLLTIDTHATVDQYPQYKTVVLVTRNAVVYPDKTTNGKPSETKVFFLSNIKQTIVIDKIQYDKLVAQIMPIVNALPLIILLLMLIVLFFFPLFGSVFILLGKMFYLLIFSLIVLLIASFMKKNISYEKVYQLSLHALTLPIIVTVVLSFFTNQYQWIYSIIFLVWISYILSLLPSPAIRI